MHVVRAGFTPLKGAAHEARDAVDLSAEGPQGDRELCLIDRARGRVVRTVEEPRMVAVRARREGESLVLELPGGGRVEGVPEPTGERVRCDYWGRETSLEVLGGPHGAALSAYLDREVALCRVPIPGAVVYGASVSLVTTGALGELARRLGWATAERSLEALAGLGARFRATFVIETDGGNSHPEDGWTDRELDIGPARVRVRRPIPRCAVVDLDPSTGRRDALVLTTLARYRRAPGEIRFGVDAVVTRPGRVRDGDAVAVRRLAPADTVARKD